MKYSNHTNFGIPVIFKRPKMPESVQNHTNFPPECFGDSWCDNGNVKSQLDSPLSSTGP